MEEEVTKDQEMEDIQNLLIETGILVPANELVHYMIRNETYMKLITSQQFKDSGISLEEVLDTEYIDTKSKEAKETIGLLRILTEMVVAEMHDRAKELDIAEDKQPLLTGFEEEATEC